MQYSRYLLLTYNKTLYYDNSTNLPLMFIHIHIYVFFVQLWISYCNFTNKKKCPLFDFILTKITLILKYICIYIRKSIRFRY